MKRITAVIFTLIFAGMLVASAQPPPDFELLTVEIINEYPHDTSAYTQGLVWHEGIFYESAGRRGVSTLREVDPETGDVLRSVPVNRPEDELSGDNPQQDYFAEGLALVGDRLIQLTWTAGEAFVYDAETFDRLDTFTYEGEGWGLCYDERFLYMTDGSQYLSVRDPDTFELIVDAAVTFQGRVINSFTDEQGRVLGRLNELECVGDYIYANSYTTDVILKINKHNGELVGLIDASNVLPAEARAELAGDEVLNGIAYNPESDTFFITGKHWSTMYEVRFVPQPADANSE